MTATVWRTKQVILTILLKVTCVYYKSLLEDCVWKDTQVLCKMSSINASKTDALRPSISNKIVYYNSVTETITNASL